MEKKFFISATPCLPFNMTKLYYKGFLIGKDSLCLEEITLSPEEVYRRTLFKKRLVVKSERDIMRTVRQKSKVLNRKEKVIYFGLR